MKLTVAVVVPLLCACKLYYGTDGEHANGGFGASTDSSIADTPGQRDAALDGAPFLIDARVDAAVDGESVSPDAPIDASLPPPCVSFAPRVDFATGRNPSLVAVADFNTDGMPDIAIVDYSAPAVSVHLNVTAAGSDTVAFATKTDFPVGAAPNNAAVGDLNGDGKPDLVVPNTYANSITFFINTTPSHASVPTFSAQILSLDREPGAIVLADFDRDGRLDLAIGDESLAIGQDVVSVFLNTTAPGATALSFGPRAQLDSIPCVQALASSDLNGDGVPDLVEGASCGGAGSGALAVLLGTTPQGATVATFQAAVQIATEALPVEIAVGDFNRDWRPDLAVASYYADASSASLNETPFAAMTPSFGASQLVATGSFPLSLAVGDLDRDGAPDIATVFGSGGLDGSIAISRNTTPANDTIASFDTCLMMPHPSAASVVIADLNADGKLDLAVANGGADTFSIYLAQ